MKISTLAKQEIRSWQRAIKEMTNGQRFTSPSNRWNESRELEGWYCYQACQPIIKPKGQETIFNNKIHNIQLVIEDINYLVLAPGQTFSFWRLVRRPITKNGFKEASIFINNQVTKQVGGGLCQISTALYSAALNLGCDIIERHPHSIDAYGDGRYFDLGQDATITFPYKDLQFRNPFPHPIVIVCEIKQLTMKVNFYIKERMCDVKVSSKIVQESPFSTLYTKEGGYTGEFLQPGSTGKSVETRRIRKFSDGTLHSENLSRDTYKPVPRIIVA